MYWNELLASGDAIYRKKNVRIQAQDGTPVSFLIRPITLGNIDLRLTAKTSTAGDAIVRQLLVKVSLTGFLKKLFSLFWNFDLISILIESIELKRFTFPLCIPILLGGRSD